MLKNCLFLTVLMVIMLDLSACVGPSPEKATVEGQPVYDRAFISDQDFEDYGSMTLDEIRAFLVEWNSCLRGQIQDVDGQSFEPAQAIYEAAQTHYISPKVLLATMEKEQRAITSTQLAPNHLALLMGAGSPSTARHQILYAAQLFRSYLSDLNTKGTTISGWKVSAPKLTEDGVQVTPANRAVAALFTYTPYAGVQWDGNQPQWGGNYLFYDAWYNKFHFGEVYEKLFHSFELPTAERSLPTAESLVIGDTNGSGKNELVVYGMDGSVTIYSFDGSLYNRIWSTDLGTIAQGSNVADADGDNSSEIIAGASIDDDHAIIKAYGFTGSSYAEEGSVVIESQTSPHHIIIADTDGDGNNEVVVADYYAVRVYKYRDNVFTEVWQYMPSPPPYGTNFWATTGDTDGDKVAEIIATQNGGHLFIFSFDATQGTYALDYEASGNGQWPHGIATGDLNRDGKNEIAVGDDQGVIRLYQHKGQTYEIVWSADIGTAADVIAIGDINNDGFHELVVGESQVPVEGYEESDGSLYVIASDGSYYQLTELSTMGEPLCSATIGDSDNDGRNEIIVSVLQRLIVFADVNVR